MNLSMMSLHRMEQQSVVSPSSCDARQKAAKEVAPFLKSLRNMLAVESDTILRWTPNGRAFEIHDMEQMMHVVLPKYFKHCKYTSFQRQLNYFSFKKWTKSKAVVCTFSNDFFLRDQPELAWRIARKKSTQLGLKTPTLRRAASAPAMTMKRIEAANFSGYREASAEDMAIMVPRSKLGRCSESYPSPTDMDMMLARHDVEAAQRYPHSLHHHHYSTTYTTNHSAAHEMESLDWIDHFLPSLESHGHHHAIKSEDPVNFHAMVPQLRGAPFTFQSLSEYGRVANL